MNKSCDKKWFFRVSSFKQHYDLKFWQNQKFQKPAHSQEPEVYSGVKNFWKISFMDHNVWFQIRGLFDGFLHHTILFLVFTLIMTSFCYFLSSPPHLCLVRGVINTAADFSAYCISTIYLWSTLKLNFRSAPRQI